MRNFHSIRPLRLLLNSQNNLSYSDSILMKSCTFNLGFKSPSNSIFLHHFEGVNPLYFENYCYWWEGYGNLKCILISHLYFLSDNFYQFSSVQSLSHVSHFPTPWTAAHQASRSITNSRNFPKLTPIQPSHPLLAPSPPAFNLQSQYQGLFKWVSSSHQVATVLQFQLQHQSFQWTPRTDLL